MAGTTYHERALEDVTMNLMADPTEAAGVVEVLRKLRAGDCDLALRDCVVQKPGALDFCDAVAFSRAFGLIIEGKVGMCEIEIGSGPHADRLEAENQRALSALPSPFQAYVDCRKERGDDGTFRWDKPIVVTRMGQRGQIDDHVTIGPNQAALEIGYTKASRTAIHLIQSPALARWPYGYDSVFLFVRLDYVRAL